MFIKMFFRHNMFTYIIIKEILFNGKLFIKIKLLTEKNKHS